jgi:hypothetical protein
MTDWIEDWIWVTRACSDAGRSVPSNGVTASKTGLQATLNTILEQVSFHRVRVRLSALVLT